MTSRILTLALTATLVTTPALGFSPATANPQAVQKDTDQAVLQEEADQLAKDFMAQANAEGAVVALSQDGVEVTSAAGNVKNLNLSANGRLTTARVGSITKLMMSTMVMQEVERGTWTLDQPISEIMPELQLDRTDITLRQLLSHTSGIPNWSGGQGPDRCPDTPQTPKPDAKLPSFPDGTPVDTEMSRDEELDKLFAGPWTADQQLAWASIYNWNFEPGTSKCYSNTGYIVVGELLQHVTRKPLSELFQERIFEPASMMTATYEEPLTQASPAESYLPDLHAYPGENGEVFHYNASKTELLWAGAAGAVAATMPEMNRFQRALHGGLLVSQASLDEIRTAVGKPQQGPNGPIEPGYGLGTYPVQIGPGQTIWGHHGSTIGTAAESFISEDGTFIVSSAVSAPKEPADQPNDDAVAFSINSRVNTLLAPELVAALPGRHKASSNS